jgi:hypothetical protein
MESPAEPISLEFKRGDFHEAGSFRNYDTHFYSRRKYVNINIL